MRVANIWTAVVGAVWAAMLWIGIGMTEDMVAKHIAGYPSAGEFTLLIRYPAGVVVVLLILAVGLNCMERWAKTRKILLGSASTFAFIFLFYYLISIGGGM